MGRSSIRRRILTLLMAEPDQRLHLREIQRRVGTTPGTASRELGRLVAAGLAERTTEGSQVYFRPTTSPFANVVRSLILVSTEPVEAELDEAVALVPTPLRPAAPDQTLPNQLAGHPAAPKADPLAMTVGARFGEIVRPLYADRLIGVYLYGPRAKGDSSAGAEVEFAVVLDKVERYGEELERTSLTCANLSLEFDVLVSRVFISERSWKSRTDGHLPDIRQEAVAV